MVVIISLKMVGMSESWATKDSPKKSMSLLAAMIPVLGANVVLIGLAFMLGWHTQTAWLVQWQTTLVPMQYNTALSFLLLGGGLVMARNKRHWLAMLLGCIVIALSLATLLQYVYSVDLGIDQFFVRHFITTKTSHPGRMAINTGICFVIGGLALLFNAILPKRGSLWTMMCGTLVASLGLTALIGYGVDLESAYGWGQGHAWPFKLPSASSPWAPG